MSSSTPLAAFSSALEDLVESVGRATVSIRSGHGLSSGTVLAAGRVVMASHGLDHETETANVLVGETSHEARVVGRDPATDLAVLEVTLEDRAPLPPSGDVPRVGAMVVSVGRAGDRLVSGAGFVHAHVGPLTRRGGRRLESLIHTTITPYPGYSGGPVVDANGRLVGIATAGIHRGAGLIVPIAAVERTANLLSKHGRIRRGFLGVTSMGVELPPAQTGPDGERAGLLVTSLAPATPAAAAGVLVGDVMVSFAGETISSPNQLMALLGEESIGRPVPLVVLRGTTRVSLTVTIAERGASAA